MRLCAGPFVLLAAAAAAGFPGCDCGGGTHLSGENDGGDADVPPDRLDTVEDAPVETPDDPSATDADDERTEEGRDFAEELVEDVVEDAAEIPACSPEPGTGPIPVPVSPENGTATGSPWASPEALTLRPLFRWRWTPDGGGDPTFEVQVDNSCATPGFAWCCFPSPEAVAAGLTDSTWRPDSELPVGREVPVGRRYYWRVRACRAEGCSTWSDVRYLDVGRAYGDWNGDGWSDLVIGAPGWARVFVYLGGGTPDATADLTVVGGRDDAFLGGAVVYAGDVNADGFADLLVGAPYAGGTGRAYLYLGSWAPDTTADLALFGEGAEAGFGVGLAGNGDVNADGFADFIVGEPAGGSSTGSAGKAYLHLGAPVPDDVPDLTFEEGIFRDSLGQSAALGDLNGDGFADMIVGAPGYDLDLMDYGPGFLYVYFGNAALDAVHDLFLSGEEAGGWFSGALSAGDLNGDGYSDLLVGAEGQEGMGAAPGGHAFLYLGGVAPDDVADSMLDGTDDEHLGSAVALTGDLNGDGIADAVLGAPGSRDVSDDPPPSAGRVLIVMGSAVIDLASAEVLTRDVAGDVLGFALATGADFDADGRADLLVGTPGQYSSGPGEAYLWLGGRAGGFGASPDLVFTGAVLGDGFGSAVE